MNVIGIHSTCLQETDARMAHEFSITAWNVVGEGEVGAFPGLYNLKGSQLEAQYVVQYPYLMKSHVILR